MHHRNNFATNPFSGADKSVTGSVSGYQRPPIFFKKVAYVVGKITKEYLYDTLKVEVLPNKSNSKKAQFLQLMS